MNVQVLHEAARSLLASAILGGDWVEYLEPIMGEMGAIGGGPSRTAPPFLFAIPTSGIREAFMDFRAGRGPPLTKNITVAAAAGEGFVADYASPMRELRPKDPFFNDFLRPRRLCHQAAAFLDETDVGSVRLLVFRDERQGQFEKCELEAFGQTLPYLRSAAMVSRAALLSMARAKAEPFERRGEPVLYLGQDGRVVEMNDRAEKASGRSFTLVGRRIAMIWQPDQSRFDRALTAALSEGRPGLVTIGGAVGVSAMMALVLPVAGDARDVFHVYSAIVVLIDPSRRGGADETAIGLLNVAAGLTEREIDVVRLVGKGRAPRDAAGDLGIGYGTLRNHLKSGYAKLGVHSQGELASLINRLN